MADELRIKVVLDSGEVKEGFLAVEKQADKTAKSIGKSFDKKGDGLSSLAEGAQEASSGLNGLASVATRVAGPVGLLVAGVVAAATAHVKFALAGEQVNAVNAQFTNIATSAGFAADQFAASIINATQGLIDDEDALQIATKGIIALGDAAKDLPQILEASRSVSRALGKDFKSTFEDLSTFVENGNARVLRQFGIVLDLEKAYAAAAKSIGLTSAALTEQQKQQIRANLILEQVPQKFSAAAESVTPLKDAFDRLKVSASNSLESIQSSFANFITKTFVDNANLSNVATGRLRSTLSETSLEIEAINKRISEIKSDALGSKSVQAAQEISFLNEKLKELRSERDKTFLEQSGRSDAELFSQLEASRNVPKAPEITRNKEQDAQVAADRIKRLQDLQAYVTAQDKLVLDAEIKRIDTITNLDQKLIAQKSLNDQQLINLEQQKNLAVNQVSEQFSTAKGFSEAQRDMAILATKQNFYNQEQALALDNANKIKMIEDNKNFSIMTGFDALSQGFSTAVEEFRNNAVKNFQDIGKTAFQTLGRGVGQAFAAFGQALATGEDAGEAFLQSMLGLFADVAIQLGTSFILQGIAHTLNPLTPGLGGPLIGAGAALATFGGLLKGLSGGKSKTSQQSVEGGGVAASPSTSTDLTQTQDLERQAASTSVSLVIQGDVLDSEESGSRIVNLINQAFDKKGVVINQGVMA